MDPAVLESMSSFGMIQKISTGYVILDLLLCLLIPKLLHSLQPKLMGMWVWMTNNRESGRFTRHIKFVKREGYYHYDPKEHNQLLQEAILLYIGSRPDLVKKFSAGDIKVFKTGDKKSGGGYSDDSDCGSYCSEDSSDCGPATELNCMMLNTSPAENEWIDVEDGVRLKRSEDREDRGRDGAQRDLNITFTICSNHIDGHARIQAFVDKCFTHYKALKNGKKDDARYLFVPISRAGRGDSGDNEDGGNATNTTVYKRYKLSDEKSFDCYFHAEKQALLYLVDHFMKKSGKFSIQGYPHKLGLLLHGPPGTGKTSLIKALAHYTGRSIVSVPLSKVKTNQELMDIMFDQSFLVHGESLPMRLPHSKVIFVMEDVDAAGSVVLRRDDTQASSSHASFMHEAFKALQSGPTTSSTSNPNTSASTSGMDKGAHPFALSSKWMDSGDDLNLAGVLNVLDGVVDCPNRILIMTTNHPEKLDPALIRPGRVNKRLFLGYMTPCDAARMVKHYFPAALESELEDLQEVLRTLDRRLVPAQLESMCAEHDTVASLTSSFELGEFEAENAQETLESHAPIEFSDGSSSEKFAYEVVGLQEGSYEASVGAVDTPKLQDSQDSQDSVLVSESVESDMQKDARAQAVLIDTQSSPVSLGMASEDDGDVGLPAEASQSEAERMQDSQGKASETGVDVAVEGAVGGCFEAGGHEPPARASGVFGSITEIEAAS